MAARKLYYIKERHNPQFKKPYYTKCGMLSKREAAEKENPQYGNNIMLSYETEQEYHEAISNLTKEGFNFI